MHVWNISVCTIKLLRSIWMINRQSSSYFLSMTFSMFYSLVLLCCVCDRVVSKNFHISLHKHTQIAGSRIYAASQSVINIYIVSPKAHLPINRTLSIECCSEISINLVFRSQCYFASIFYSIAYVFIWLIFIFFVTFHSMSHVRLSYV